MRSAFAFGKCAESSSPLRSSLGALPLRPSTWNPLSLLCADQLLAAGGSGIGSSAICEAGRGEGLGCQRRDGERGSGSRASSHRPPARGRRHGVGDGTDMGTTHGHPDRDGREEPLDRRDLEGRCTSASGLAEELGGARQGSRCEGRAVSAAWRSRRTAEGSTHCPKWAQAMTVYSRVCPRIALESFTHLYVLGVLSLLSACAPWRMRVTTAHESVRLRHVAGPRVELGRGSFLAVSSRPRQSMDSSPLAACDLGERRLSRTLCARPIGVLSPAWLRPS